MQDVTVLVPESRIADFYSALAQWLAGGAQSGALGEPDPDRPLRPLRRPHGTGPGQWVWAVDPQWRIGTTSKTCRYRTDADKCSQTPTVAKVMSGRTDSYCDEHMRHYGRRIQAGKISAWQWRQDRR